MLSHNFWTILLALFCHKAAQGFSNLDFAIASYILSLKLQFDYI